MSEESFWKKIIHDLPSQIAILDGEGNVEAANRAFEEVAEATGVIPPEVGPDDVNYLEACAAAAAEGCRQSARIHDGLRAILDGEAAELDMVYSRPLDGRGRYFKLSARPLEDEESGMVVIHDEVTAVMRDPLTGLANRGLFDAQLRCALDAAKRSGRPVGLLVIDLDGFKQVNDTLGHAAGDALLVEVARRFRRVTRASDTVARLGGDEFAIILEGPDAAIMARTIAPRLAALAREPVSVDGHVVRCGASIGIAVAPVDGRCPKLLLEKADASMYEAKKARTFRAAA